VSESAPAEFYTGLVSELYGVLRGSPPDPEPSAQFVARYGQPALELGCGDGDPMLDLLRRGLQVEGLDSSADMLARCRRRAETLGLDVALHHATMEAMDLGRTYPAIYLAGPTFNLLTDDDAALAALRRIRAHLQPGGTALIPLFVPSPVPPELLGRARERTDGDAVVRFSVLSVERDEAQRLQVAHVRYERDSGAGREALERDWILHWHTQSGFAALLADAELTAEAVVGAGGASAEADATEFAFVVRRPSNG
jgi:SAM-dependent methyltransferase